MVSINETNIDNLINKIVEKVTNKVLREILKDMADALNKLTISISELTKAQEKTEEKLSELAEAQRRTEERLNQLAARVDQLAEAQRRTEERLNQLAARVDQLAEAQRRTELTLNSLIGEVARMRGELIETKVVMDLNTFLSKRGFDVFHHFPNIPYVDVVVETDGFIAAIEICKRCDLRDIDQVIRGAKILEEKEGIKPDVLVVFSYTGEIEKGVMDLANREGIIVEWNTRRLVRKLLELSKMKQNN